MRPAVTNDRGVIDLSSVAAPGVPDERVASEIRAIGRAHLARGGRVTLAEMLGIVPGLADRPAPLDAAIDIALRCASGSSTPSAPAVERLLAEHPELGEAIRTAAVLARALWSSESVAPIAEPATLPVPCDFGAPIADGRPRYALEALEGVGSSGAVYRAMDRSLSAAGRPVLVAVKVLHASRTDPVTRARFMEEASKARLLDHPHAVRVFDRGESADGSQYIVYELVESGDLHGWVSGRSGPVPAREAARMVEQIAGAIQAAHSAGMVHLDLKPANVLVTRDGAPKVADFGLAVHEAQEGAGDGSGPDRSIGTLAFMPPEQFAASPGWASPLADVYALGGILLWLLTGAMPNGGTRAEIQRTLRDPADGAAQSARVRAAWGARSPDRVMLAICTRALAPNPADRYATASELAADLCAWREHRPIRWMRPGLARTASLFARRRPATAALLVVCAASMIGALVASERARAAAVARATAEAAADLQSERADEVQRWRAIARDGLAALYENMQVNKKTGLVADMLMSVWYLESIYGPVLLDDPLMLSQTRALRLELVRELADQAVEAGGPASLQALHMRTLLGFLLARDERLEEADAVMAEVQPLWVARVDPSDPWLQDIELVRLTIRAGLGVAALESAPPVGEARLRLVEYERAILAHVQRLKGQSNGLQLRRLALVRLRQMYSDSCFANAEWEKWSVDVLRILNQDVIDRRVADDTGAASRAAASPALQAGVVEGDTEP